MLEIIDLHERYDDVVAPDGCTSDVRRGLMLGFLGPNGAGKTTAMRSIFGLARPDGGRSFSTIVVLVRLSGRVYAGALLRFGARIRWSEAFRAAE